MPNNFEYATWLSMTSLDLLESKRAVSQHFNTDYSKEFKQKFAIGESVNVPYPQQFTIRRGLDYNPQAINRRHATVTFNDPFGIDFEWDSAEALLRTPRGRDKVKRDILDPAMSQLAQDIDSQAALFAYQNAANVVGVLGTDPNTYDATSAAARQKMQELECPDTGDRAIIVPPSVMRAVKNSGLTFNNPASDITKQFRKGYVSQSDGFDWYESMSLYRHTAGTWAGAVTVATTTVDGATTLAVTCTTGDTFMAGDKISVASSLPVHPQTRRTFGTSAKVFAITVAATGVASAATLSISPAVYGPGSQYQNVSQHLTSGSALTLWPGTAAPSGKVGQVGVALHRNAFALVSGELEMPKESSVELASTQRDPDSGVQISFIRAWDNRARKMTNRFDAMIGFGSFYNDACAVGVACG